MEAGTVTRYDDMLKIKGNNIWPSAMDELILSYKEISEYKGTVFIDKNGRESARIEFSYKPEYKALSIQNKEGLTLELRNRIKEKTNVVMDIVEVERDDLPDFEYKSRRWKDLRQETFLKK